MLELAQRRRAFDRDGHRSPAPSGSGVGVVDAFELQDPTVAVSFLSLNLETLGLGIASLQPDLADATPTLRVARGDTNRQFARAPPVTVHTPHRQQLRHLFTRRSLDRCVCRAWPRRTRESCAPNGRSGRGAR